MSHLAMEWARLAPVANATERAILMEFAYRAGDDGTDAFPSKKTLAEVAMCHPKTVQAHLSEMRKRGLIKPGNQAAANYLPEYARPTVYDLMIPCEWYSEQQLETVNKKRAEKGLRPLTPEMRPPLAKPGKRTHPSKGTKRAQKSDDVDPTREHNAPPWEQDAPGEQQPPEGGASCSDTREHNAPQTGTKENRSSEPSFWGASDDEPGLFDTTSGGSSDADASKPTKPNTSSTSKQSKRGTRLPDDFTVTVDMVAWARKNTPLVDGKFETAQFIDYWASKPGQAGVKLDWRRTWQTWMRNAQKRAEERHRPNLRVVGGYQPYRNPDPSAYHGDF